MNYILGITMKINHRPLLTNAGISKVIEHFSKQNNTEVRYVCTSSVSKDPVFAADIFYQDVPYAKAGNRYFGLYYNLGLLYIVDADNIENLSFTMLKGLNGWEYSQHRHDYVSVGNSAIDGGRAYTRIVNPTGEIKTCRIIDGKFKKDETFDSRS